MAGLGRRTHYRKHLTDSVLYDLPSPEVNERIAKVCSTRGSNQFDLLLSRNIDDANAPPEIVLAILPTKFRKLIWLKRNDFVIVQTGLSTHTNLSIRIDSNHNQQSTDAIDQGRKQSNTERHDDVGFNCKSPEFTNDNSDDNNVYKVIEDLTKKERTTNSDSSTGIKYMISHILYKDQIKHLISIGKWPTHPDFEWPHRSNNNDALEVTQNLKAMRNQITIDYDSEDIDFEDINSQGLEEDAIGDEEDLNDNDAKDDNNNMNNDDPLLFVNTNRLRYVTVQDSESSGDDDRLLISRK